MKATIRYRDVDTHKYRTKTITVEQDEPNSIIREFLKVTRVPRYTRITTVKCGRTEYQWHAMAIEAIPSHYPIG